MSFALEYRRRLQSRQREELAAKKANEGFVALPLDASADTARNRRRVLVALLVAAAVLGVFNSGGLVNYTRDMYETRLGRNLILASERWHAVMQDRQVTEVVERIRGTVAMARQTEWGDFALGVFVEPEELPGAAPRVVPANGEPRTREPLDPPRMALPAAPVLRASVNAREE